MKKNKLGICLLFISLLSIVTVVSAIETGTTILTLNIRDNEIELTNDKFPDTNPPNPFPFDIQYSDGSICENCVVDDKSFDWVFKFETGENVTFTPACEDLLKNLSSSYPEIVIDLANCEFTKGSFNQKYIACEEDLFEYTSGNATGLKEQINICSNAKRDVQRDLTSEREKVADLKKEQEDTGNQKWFFAVGGIIAGIFGWRFYKGEIGSKGAVKDKSVDEFNRMQAG